METIVILDGNSLLFRAFYALPLLSAPSGEYTNALHGFANMLQKVIDQAQPDAMLAAFDEHGATFRHEQYAQYKAGRKTTPPELLQQIPLIQQMLGAMQIAVCKKQGLEADDFIGTYATHFAEKGYRVIIITGDRDALQLINDAICVWITRKGISEIEVFDKEHLNEVYGLAPEQIVDLKGLMGDASDNIPGVPGVGEKTALKLLHEFYNIDGIYANIDTQKGKLKERLVENRETAYFSRDLATIRRDAPMELTAQNCALGNIATPQTYEFLTQYGLNGFKARLFPEQPVAQKPAFVVETVLLESENTFAALLAQAKQHGVLALYDAVDKLYFSCTPTIEYVCEINDTFLPGGYRLEDVYRMLAPAFLDVSIAKYANNAKKLLHAVWDLGLDLQPLVFDPEIAAYVLDATRKNHRYQAIVAELTDGICRDEPFAAEMIAAYTGALEKTGDARALLEDVEMPLARVLAQMEREGFSVDRAVLEALGTEFTQRIDALTQQIIAYAGHAFNIASPKQLGTVLFEELKLPAGKRTATGYSTDIEVLNGLMEEHPIIPAIVEFRRLSKLKGTYIDGMRTLIGSDGKIHSSFNQTVTATGRISSAEPNLQNIPVREEEGRRIREMFCAKPGHMLVDADYSQIELRVLAHISGDETLIDAFLKGQDIHQRTAAEVWDVPLDDVTSSMRSGAKAVNFGIVYGISDFGLARNIGISRKEAADFIAKYLNRYRGVHQYMLSVVESARRNKYVETLLHRRRYLAEYSATNAATRSFADRVAMNAPIQGTAADIIKLAMVRVTQALAQNNLKAKLILQVHDELIIEAPEDEVDCVALLLKQQMEAAYTLRVPLLVEVGVAKRWIDSK